VTGHSVVAGTTCLLTATAGADLTGSGVDGLFIDDCRHLSRLVLRVQGSPLRVLRRESDSTVYAPETARHEDPPYLLVRRRQVLPGRLIESLELTSFVAGPRTIEVGYELAADFADQFELRSARAFDKSDAIRTAGVVDGRLVFSYARRGFTRTTTVDTSPAAVPSPPVEANTRGVDAVSGEEAEPLAKEKPVQADLGPVLLGLDPERAGAEVIEHTIQYTGVKP